MSRFPALQDSAWWHAFNLITKKNYFNCQIHVDFTQKHNWVYLKKFGNHDFWLRNLLITRGRFWEEWLFQEDSSFKFPKCAIHCWVRISSVSWCQMGKNRRKSDGFKTDFTAWCSMLSAMWTPSAGEHIFESWVTEIALHTCLTSARKSVSKIKGLKKVCK